LSAEQDALAQTALRLASAADAPDLAGYALAAVVKEYRAVLRRSGRRRLADVRSAAAPG
jgi:hypothetical protein